MGLVLVVVAVVIAVVAVFMTSGGEDASASGIPSAAALLSQADAAAGSAGCDAVQETPNYANAPGDDPAIDHTHIGTPPVTSPPALSTYATIPPASGPHDPSPLPAGVYDSPPDVYRTIHSLEHGAVIIWYSPDATGKQLDDLIAFYSQPAADPDIGQAKIIIAPYDYPDQGAAGQLPAGVQMAVVAWHRLQTCTAVSLPVAFGFSSQLRGPWVRRPDVQGRRARAERCHLADGSQEEAEAAPTAAERDVDRDDGTAERRNRLPATGTQGAGPPGEGGRTQACPALSADPPRHHVRRDRRRGRRHRVVLPARGQPAARLGGCDRGGRGGGVQRGADAGRERAGRSASAARRRAPRIRTIRRRRAITTRPRSRSRRGSTRSRSTRRTPSTTWSTAP